METATLLLFAVLAAAAAFFLGRRRNGLDSLERQVSELRQASQAQTLQSVEQISRLTQAVSDRLLEVTQRLTQGVETQLHRVRTELESRLSEQTRALQAAQGEVGSRLDTAARIVQEVSGRLSQMEESHKRIYEVGKDIASLQEILRAPKLRGGFGELLLGDLLRQILPEDRYRLQHAFSSGQKVDAALMLGDRIVPVDAKFPMENFKRLREPVEEAERKRRRREFARDVEKHIVDIAGKYILPAENTYDFALMYIPAENVYYELILRDEEGFSISEAALARRVIPVSPNSFYAYLQVILLGLKGLNLEERTREILKLFEQVSGNLARFREHFDRVGNQLQHSRTNWEKALQELDRLELHVEQLTRFEKEAAALPGRMPIEKS